MSRYFPGRILFTVAVAFTVAWLGLGVGYVVLKAGWRSIAALAPPELAAILAAVSLPPVLLWLVVTVVDQRRALSQIMTQDRHTLHQLEAQTRTLLQLQAEASRGRHAETRSLAMHDLAANAAVLAERLGVMSKESATAAWSRYGAGDVTVFVQAFLTFAVSHPEIADKMAEAVIRDDVARAALATFVRRYQRLTASLTDDKMALEILDEGALGRGFRLFKRADDLASAGAAAEEAVPHAPHTPEIVPADG